MLLLVYYKQKNVLLILLVHWLILMDLLLKKVHKDETNDVWDPNPIECKKNEMKTFLFYQFYLWEGDELFCS